jgi:hypothetical protein
MNESSGPQTSMAEINCQQGIKVDQMNLQNVHF